MSANVREALEQLAAAVHDLFGDAGLARIDPGERHVVSELHALLRPRFPKHWVSNEFDRRENEIKKLGRSKIVPDLIVHRRGDQTDNLLVVEVKLAGNYNFESDVRKLKGMTQANGEYGYAAGLHLVLDVPRQRIRRGDVYINSTLDRDLTEWFWTVIEPREDAVR